MQFILPVESIVQKKGGVVLYDPGSNKILKQYVHDKQGGRPVRVGWRGGQLYDQYIIVTDWSELHYFNVKKWKYERSFKKDTFKNLHNIGIYDDKLYVINTGLNIIEMFKNPLEPEFEKIIYIDLKHPNCIAFKKERIFVTCLGHGDTPNSEGVVELNSGKRIFEDEFSCHDGIFHGNDFYLTHTSQGAILEFKDLCNKKIPISPTNIIKIGAGKGWWRGMIIVEDVVYVFASDGYRKKKATIRMATVNLKTMARTKINLPVVDGIHWDTIYQPNFYT